jgi:hypothetical protein
MTLPPGVGCGADLLPVGAALGGAGDIPGPDNQQERKRRENLKSNGHRNFACRQGLSRGILGTHTELEYCIGDHQRLQDMVRTLTHAARWLGAIVSHRSAALGSKCTGTQAMALFQLSANFAFTSVFENGLEILMSI